MCTFQVGKGPQASEVSGIVKIGQTMTMVIGVKDDENKFDMMVSTINAVNVEYNIQTQKYHKVINVLQS